MSPLISVILYTAHQTKTALYQETALSAWVSRAVINPHDKTMLHNNASGILTSRFMTPDQETWREDSYNACALTNLTRESYLYPPKAALLWQCRKSIQEYLFTSLVYHLCYTDSRHWRAHRAERAHAISLFLIKLSGGFAKNEQIALCICTPFLHCFST